MATWSWPSGAPSTAAPLRAAVMPGTTVIGGSPESGASSQTSEAKAYTPASPEQTRATRAPAAARCNESRHRSVSAPMGQRSTSWPGCEQVFYRLHVGAVPADDLGMTNGGRRRWGSHHRVTGTDPHHGQVAGRSHPSGQGDGGVPGRADRASGRAGGRPDRPPARRRLRPPMECRPRRPRSGSGWAPGRWRRPPPAPVEPNVRRGTPRWAARATMAGSAALRSRVATSLTADGATPAEARASVASSRKASGSAPRLDPTPITTDAGRSSTSRPSGDGPRR